MQSQENSANAEVVDEPCDFGLHTCEGCPFRGAKVGWRGNPKADLVIVGESPGTMEVIHKPPMPFVGPSGAILWDALGCETPEKIAEFEERAFITNALQCRPQGGKKTQDSMDRAAHMCQGRLLREIQAHPRKLIIALGNPAVRSLTGNFGIKITRVRGQPIKSPLAELGILPALHPAALLRGTGSYRQFMADLQYALQIHRTGKLRKPGKPRTVVLTRARLRKVVKKFRRCAELDGDIETTGLNRITCRIRSLGISNDPRLVYIIPEELLPDPLVAELMGYSLPKWNWHNGKFDVSFLRRDHIPARVDDDTMLMSYALDENRGGKTGGLHDLETISIDLLGAEPWKYMTDCYTKGKHGSYEKIPRDVLYEYQGRDVSNMAQCRPILRARVAASDDLEKLYTRTLLPYNELLLEIERNGIFVDREELETNRVRLSERVDSAREKLCELAGMTINPNSPYDVADLLFDKFGLKGTDGRSTAKEVLEKLPQEHPAVIAVKLHRKAAKALSTYVESIEDAICPDGRVHSTYLIHGTKTGRLSSAQPNMQNIPRPPVDPTEPNIRAQFRAPPGRKLVAIDYNQAELRVLAILSQDPDLLAIYQNTKRSLHKEVAKDKWGENYNKEQYMKAKNVNFGIVYGITAWGLSEQISSSIKEAQEYLDWWLQRFPGARDYLRRCKRAAIQGETITTCFGRKKRHWIVSQENVQALMNEAQNFACQSIASDLTGHTGIRIHRDRLLDKWDSFPVNIVHDELLLEIPDHPEVEREVIKLGIEVAQQIPAEWGLTQIPFIAEAKTGLQWGRMEEYKLAA